MSLTTPVSRPAASQDPIRIMVVDDSAVIRGSVIRILEAEPNFTIVASVSNGQMAVDRLRREKVDVIILDIEMPVMDGLTAIPLLIGIKPDVRIIMASTLTQRNADISIRALSAGAADYIPKPNSAANLSSDEFRVELIKKVKILGAGRSRGARTSAAKSAVTVPVPALRKAVAASPELLAIGSSTGGPQALFAFMSNLRKDIGVPIVITQHMPPMFTKLLAEHVTKSTGWPCKEGEKDDILMPNNVYIAPGDFHMTIVAAAGVKRIALDQNPPESFCRPSVDPMLRSAVKVFGGRIAVVILTGMGSDGCKGSQVVVDAGGSVIAQDEASSVVWGMPGAVARAGLCTELLPPPQLASKINLMFARP